VREDSNSIKSEINQPEIDYKDNMKQKGAYFEGDNIDMEEIRDYLKL
jgi:hypothetical protein